MASAVPLLIEALLTGLQADPVLTDVVILDGPEVNESGLPEWVIVGYDGDEMGDFQAAQTVGGWTGLATTREEQLSLTVAVLVSTGETTVREARVRAYAIAGRVDAFLAADPTAGTGAALQVAVEATTLQQVQTGQGLQVRLLLTVAGQAMT
jgi:hypothetical protein